MKNTRGGPGDYERRLARANRYDAPQAASEALSFLAAVLAHQQRRAEVLEVQDAAGDVASHALSNGLAQQYPLLELELAVEPIAAEVVPAVAALGWLGPSPLGLAGEMLASRPRPELSDLVRNWLDDTTLVDPRTSAWVRISAAPVLELAAARTAPPSKEEWAGRACPVCGDAPQCSAIVEESGAFLQGSPRYLVCARCASWWAFSRAVCACCGEDDSRRIVSYRDDDRPWARIDACDTCRGYIKTFDLREKGAVEVIPSVDDVATLALDVWAHEHGLQRPALSLAGV